jgi:serine/threonine protein kinase
MTQPETVDDVLALVRRSRLVDDESLKRFLGLFESAHMSGLAPTGILSLMVEQHLLTKYQADELAQGHWMGFWVGGYRVLDRLGRGGMGTVFLAEHPLLGKRVALKVLTGGLQGDQSIRSRFMREARAAAALDHPNIVQIFHADVDHDPPFLVMEFVDGVSLQAAVAHHGPFTPEEAATVGMRVCHGLSAASAVGLIHRDIKPANLLVDRRGQVKILDLGIARFARDPDSRLVDSDTILGTLDYLAPEQAQNSSAVDPRADLYALGATMYYLLAGHPPFTDDDISRKLHQKLTSDPPPLHEVRSSVPVGLSRVVERLLERDPADRFQTPDDAAAAMQTWAVPGPAFPERLFQPWKPTDADAPVQATEFGQDRDPTPLPATRRITRPKDPSVASPSTSSIRSTQLPAHDSFISGEVGSSANASAGLQTMRLTRPPNPPTGFTRLRFQARAQLRYIAVSTCWIVKSVLSWLRSAYGSSDEPRRGA